MASELKWMAEARKYIGEQEIKGSQNNPLIEQWWRDIKRGGIKDDETPWCAAFTGAMLEHVGIRSSRFESAKSYITWGMGLEEPVYGCVAVLTREGGGHVGFVVGLTQRGELLILGGNQGDAVNIRAFPRSRITTYRWPIGEPASGRPLEVMNGNRSEGEA